MSKVIIGADEERPVVEHLAARLRAAGDEVIVEERLSGAEVLPVA